ncbi:transketolase, C-terminal domain protein [Mycobacterium xenopi 4042]|uniref:Transketolase, C-terminal domain protein n=1 Tax=Mycobacterium xenopi 4042 TaxID=1299334 RepID=X7YP41_MYCXE|nr:transketolase, C-terminal domain protein [Mycobacterium xenopi 4042]
MAHDPGRGNGSGPVGLILTRQGVPVLEGTSLEGVARGGYVLGDTGAAQPDVILIGTGSEVQIAVAAQKVLADKGITARVVSMPCVEWFESQPYEYQESVLPADVTARVAVEAGVAMPWHKIVGDAGKSYRSSTTGNQRITRPCTGNSASPQKPSSPRPNDHWTTPEEGLINDSESQSRRIERGRRIRLVG